LGSFALEQDLFSFLLEHTPDQIYFKDRGGRFLRVSHAVAQYMHVSGPEDLIGKSDFDFWSQETARECFGDEQRIIQTGEPMVGKIEKLVFPDGRVTWDYTTKLPLKNSKGEIIGICGINKDFTAFGELTPRSLMKSISRWPPWSITPMLACAGLQLRTWRRPGDLPRL
jgi:PAS domain S-box-containing protein